MTHPSDRELSGMTVNERLAACGLFQRWDAAVAGKNKDEMIAMLCDVAIPKNEAKLIAEAVLKDPEKYGFR